MSRYAGALVDAHHHFWEPSAGRQPWLRPGAAIPFRYGPYESIKRDYLPPDLERDAAGAGFRLVGSVAMETEWDDSDPMGEINHIESVESRFSLPSAAIGRVALNHDDAPALLEQMAERSIVRGIRHKPGQAATPHRAAAEPTLLSDARWRERYALLERLGLGFELQTAWWHLDEAVDLVQSHPGVMLTINHAALPSDRSRAGLEGWAAAITRVARLPQVWMKLSGIGLRGTPWTAENNREIALRALEAFGTDRVMVASNFPVDGLTGTYAEIMGGFAKIFADLTPAEQLALFAGNAIRRYRLDPTLLDR